MTADALAPLGRALLHFVWQGALLAGALRLFAAGAAGARTRYAAACATLALMAAVFAAPVRYELRAAGGPRAAAAAPPPGRAWAAPRPPREPAVRRAGGGAAGDPRPAMVRPAAVRLRAALAHAPTALAAAWLAGVGVLAARLAGGWALTRRLLTRGVTAAPAACERQLRRLCAELRVRVPVRLLVSARVAVPTVVGWLRPAILLPAGAVLGLTPEQLAFLLRHELAHVLRHDYVVNALQRGAEVVLFYHPAVWWVSRAVSLAREQCCDEVALGGGDVADYLRALLAAEAARGPAAGGAAFALGADGGPLLARARYLALAAGATGGAAPGGARPAAGAAAGPAGALAAAALLAAAGGLAAPRPSVPNAAPLPRPAAGAAAPRGGPACPSRRAGDPLTLCPALAAEAAAALAATGREGAVVVQDVATGAVLAYVAAAAGGGAAPGGADAAHAVTRAAVPASVWKLVTATLWWEHDLPDGAVPCPASVRVGGLVVTQPAGSNAPAVGTVEDALAYSCNPAAVAMTLGLRDALGPGRLLAEYGRLGFPSHAGAGAGAPGARDLAFWATSSASWRARMSPAASGARVAAGASDASWARLALGLSGVQATPLHVSRFLQMVGAGGVQRPPTVEAARAARPPAGARLVSAATAARVRRALLATVRRGTASGVRPLLAGAGWQLGGKTGTAPGRDPGRPDGWFAGLMFDARGAARYTVVVHVRGGGAGGGAAARVAAALTRAAAREADG